MKNVFVFWKSAAIRSRVVYKKAFTLSEVLLTLAVIGVVAALTIGIIKHNATTLENKVGRARFMNDLSIALANMQLEGKLAGYSSTEEFVQEFKKYYDIETECSGGANCLANIYRDNENGDISAPEDSYDFVFKDKSGTTVGLSYNPSCSASTPFAKDSSQANRAQHDITLKNSALKCVEGVYDINGGEKEPNKIGEDAGRINPYPANTPTCEGNFIPDDEGNCISPVTKSECASMGRTLNEKIGACVCNTKCPIGQKLNENTCKCECNLTADSCDGVYSTFDPNTCTCKTTLNIPIQCAANGGIWNSEKGSCECIPEGAEGSCVARYNGYAYADQKDFCKCKCNTANSIKTQINKNVKKDKSFSGANKYTVASDDISNGCYTCKESTSSAFTIENDKENGLCVPKGSIDASSCINDGTFFVWQGYNPANEDDSFYCKCVLQQEYCTGKFEQAYAEQIGGKPKDNACKGKNSSTYYYGCATNRNAGRCQGCTTNDAYKAINGTLKTTANDANVAGQNSDKNTCYCRPSAGQIPRNATPTIYFHGNPFELAIAFTFNTKDVNNISGAYYSGTSTVNVKNALVQERTRSWYDPIILNVAASNALEEPKTTKDIATKFKGQKTDDGIKEIVTSWLNAQSSPAFYFLVNDKNKNGKVDDITELYSEQEGELTGLHQLEKQFKGTTTNNAVIKYNDFRNSNLKLWADMNSDAIVNGSESLKDLLKLTAASKTVVVTPEQKDEEGNVISPAVTRNELYFTNLEGLGVYAIHTKYTAKAQDETGAPLRTDTAVIAIQGRFKKLVPISKIDSSYTVEIVPVSVGVNPEVKYVDVKTGTAVTVVTYLNNMQWTDKYYLGNSADLTKEINGAKVFLKVVSPNGKITYYGEEVRGLTDVIFDFNPNS